MYDAQRASILDCLVDITAQRDTELLEVTLLKTMIECFDMHRVRLCMVHFDTREIYRLREACPDGTIRDCGEAEIAELGEITTAFDTLSENHGTMSVERGDETVLIYPLFIINVNIGFILIYHGANQRIDVRLMTNFLRIYNNYITLLVDSQRDSLTGLMNRKTFDDKIMNVIEYKRRMEAGLFSEDQQRKATAHHDDFWLGIFDIDDFKRINDRYGHLYGDEVLILLGGIMKDSFRNNDIMIRYGGEEFIVVIRAAEEDEAFTVFSRFREKVESHAFPGVDRITVSVGVKLIRAGEPPTVIVGHADQALYYAKQQGKNRVFIYDRLLREGLIKSSIAEGEVRYL